MSYRVELSDLAVEQAFEIESYYDAQMPGLGGEFLDYLFACYLGLESNPSRWQILHQDIRRALVDRFPYSVFYRIKETDQKVEVLTVLHQSSNPNQWP